MTTIPMPEPADLALVLRSYADKPDEVLIRDDTAAKEWDGAADNDERWFIVGDYESDPLCWDVVTQAAAREGATLAELAVKAGPGAALAERVRIVNEIRQHAEKVRKECVTPSAGVALGAIVDSVADMVNTLPEDSSTVEAPKRRIGLSLAEHPDGPPCAGDVWNDGVTNWTARLDAQGRIEFFEPNGPGYVPADVDRALRELARGDSPHRDILLEEQVNQKALTCADRAAAIRVGGRDLTEIRIG